MYRRLATADHPAIPARFLRAATVRSICRELEISVPAAVAADGGCYAITLIAHAASDVSESRVRQAIADRC